MILLIGSAPSVKERQLSTHVPAIRTEVLRTVLIAYAAASLLHFGHNAEHLSEYPNLPTWITRADVYLSWLAQTAIGLGACLSNPNTLLA